MIKRRILIGLAIGHFLIIIFHNILGVADGLTVIYGKNPQAEDEPSALGLSRSFIYFTPIHYYAHLSGAETGFGFFAPQVGSQYISLFKLYDAKDQLIAEYQQPILEQQESMHRYAAFLDLFQELIAKEKDEQHLDQRYARAILYSISERLGEHVEGTARIVYSISVYQYPKLEQIHASSDLNAPQGRLVQLFESTIHIPNSRL